MNENKNELMLWVGILAIIGIFIFFMPDIERFVFGQAKKDKEAGQSEVKKEEDPNKEQKNITPTKEKKETIPAKYECSRSKTESFYKENSKQVYTYDKKGNTLTVDSEYSIVIDNADSYNQMKATYGALLTAFDKLDAKFKNYYVNDVKFDDANRTINATFNVKDYANAVKMINEYNESHENETITLDIYKTYSETEINMKSEGYTCK